MFMSSLTVKHLLELKGVRQISFVQVTRESEAIAASGAGMALADNHVRDIKEGQEGDDIH